MMGVMKNSSCTTEASSGPMSRYRVARMPKQIDTHTQFSTISAQRRDDRQVGPLPRFRIDDRDDHEDDDVVAEQDQLPPHQPVDVDRQRRRKLFDQTFVGDEDVGAFEDRGVDQVPDDQAERDVGQVLLERQLEQLRVQQAHRHCGGAGGDGDPERAEHAAPVALLDVLPAQVQPQFALAEAFGEIAYGPGHGLGLGCRVGERHLVFLLSNRSSLKNLLTAQPPQANPFAQTRGVAAGHQKVPAEPHPLLGQEFAQPRLGQAGSHGCGR